MKSTTEYRQQFDTLVHRAEEEISAKPQAYRTRLKLLALLGYAVIFGLLILLLALVGGSIFAALASSAFLLLLIKKKLIFVLGGIIWLLARSLFVRIQEPEGFELTRDQSPKLWNEVDVLQKQLATPNIHKIILEPDFNAAIAQTPRFGIIGPYKNTLILGLELLMTLPPDQVRSVLAHELAHLSGEHNKFSAWIYRVRLSWSRINRAFHESNAWGTGIIRRFTDWYAPYFAGYSYVLARDNEYEADALAGQLTSNDTAAAALVNVYAYGSMIDSQYWQNVYKKAYTQAEPVKDVYVDLQKFLRNKDQYQHEYKRCLRNALSRKTSSADTHPALMDRIKALKSTGLTHESSDLTALEWLGGYANKAMDHFNRHWVANNHQQWHDFHNRAMQAKQDIAELQRKDYNALNADEKWTLAMLTDRYMPNDDALPLFQKYYEDYPKDTDAAYAIGRLMLDRDDERGISYINQAMETPALQQYAAEEAWQYYSRQQQTQQANEWLVRSEKAYDMMNEADAERQIISEDDTIIPPDVLDIPQNQHLESALLGDIHTHKKVKQVWIAQKAMQHFPEQPTFVLGVKLGGFIYDEDKILNEVTDLVESDLNVYIVTNKSSKALYKKIEDVGKHIY